MPFLEKFNHHVLGLKHALLYRVGPVPPSTRKHEKETRMDTQKGDGGESMMDGRDVPSFRNRLVETRKEHCSGLPLTSWFE